MESRIDFDCAQAEMGDWVKAVHYGPSQAIDDNLTVPPGTLGKVVFIDLDGVTGTRHIEWQNGARLGAVPGHDAVQVVLPAKPCKVCGLRCSAVDVREYPDHPEDGVDYGDYVHDEDREFDDHTAEV